MGSAEKGSGMHNVGFCAALLITVPHKNIMNYPERIHFEVQISLIVWNCLLSDICFV